MFTRSRPFAALAAVLVLGGLVAACGSDDGSSSGSNSGSGSNSASNASNAGAADSVKVYTEDDTDITVALEHEFVVELPATPSTGYEWTAVTNPALQQETTEQIQGGAQPGAEGTQRITFRSQEVGTTSLVLNYARSFEPDQPPAKTQTFQVTVKSG
jgi:predicted secreted protein